jgi:hypothetical protein
MDTSIVVLLLALLVVLAWMVAGAICRFGDDEEDGEPWL